MSLKTYFRNLGKAQATPGEMVKAGFKVEALDRAVKRGDLRKGVCGYWVPRACDPGAALVFQTAINSAK